MNKITLLFSLPLIGSAFSLAPTPATAQFGPSKIATAAAVVKPISVVRGGKGNLVVTLTVKPQYHINANKPNDPAYIATVFTAQPMPGIVFGPAHFPAPKLIKVSYSPKPLLVYTGQVRVMIPFTVTSATRPGTKMLAGSVAFQGCDAKSCYPPAAASVKAAVTVR